MVFIAILIAELLKSEYTASGLPSPLRSPIAIPFIAFAAGNVANVDVVNVPLPLFVKRIAFKPFAETAIISGLPSPLRSPTAK